MLGMGEASLIFGGWIEKSTPLFVLAELPAISVCGKFSVQELTDGGVLLNSLDRGADLSVGLSDPETLLWYFEPREFSSKPEYAEEFKRLFSSVPDVEKMRSLVSAKFSIRVTAPGFPDLLVPAGKVFFMELFNE